MGFRRGELSIHDKIIVTILLRNIIEYWAISKDHRNSCVYIYTMIKPFTLQLYSRPILVLCQYRYNTAVIESSRKQSVFVAFSIFVICIN